MTNGYGVCPTCGCPPQWQGGPWQQWQGPAGPPWQGGPWQGGQMWAGPAWGAGPGWQGCGQPGWGPGPYAPPAPTYAPAYYGGLPTDSEIEEMIYDAIDADPLIPFDANTDITVEAGTVYLRGEVPSKRIKHAAGDDAWWIPGVVDVHNEIKVTLRRRAGQPEEETAEQQA